MSDDLLQQADDLRTRAVAALDPVTQDRLGQFLTPRRAAELIAAMPRLPASGSTIRVLDPGAGSGMLMAALLQRLAHERPGSAVHVIAIEVDEQLRSALAATAPGSWHAFP